MYEHIPAELLIPALEAGRAALRDMDEDDVPNKLRKVVAYSGGSLPPPLARSLSQALDDDSHLRSEALEQWKGADLAASGSVGASALYLIRPENWQFLLGKVVARHEAMSAQAEVEDLTGRLAQAEKEAAEGKRRVGELRQELSKARRNSKRPKKEPQRPINASRLEDKIKSLERARDEAERSHAALADRAKQTETKLRQARTERAEVLKKFEAAGGIGWGSGDPIVLARHLDDVASVVAGSRVAEYFRETMGFEPGPWKLPPGALPDGANSIEWLMRQPRPFVLIVDGHNLAHKIRPESAASADTRDEMSHALARMKLHTKTVARVIVVFDSSVSPLGEAYRGPSGVEIRFASSAASADDEILALAEELTDIEVVVVSSDRLVREGAERHGAIGLWSEAIKEWMSGG
ncbi:MAG: hypothetical protein HKO76_08865 [Acidimicrobiia bacterium]|nr:hypothetical protein [Acidimicrobiia bacterium]